MYDENVAKRQIEFQAMLPVLPPVWQVESVLDIGCGHAIIDVHLARHYPFATFHLVDSSEHVPHEGKNQVGYNNKTIAWKDRNAGMAVLAHHHPALNIVGHDPDPSLTIPCNLVVSLRSWGHHYPIAEYIDLVNRSLAAGGRIIVDLRFWTPGRTVFESAGFRLVEVIAGGSKKCERTVWERA